MENETKEQVKKARGVKPGTKRGPYKRSKNNIVENVPDMNNRENTEIKNPIPTELDGTNFGSNSAVLDMIDEVGRNNMKALEDEKNKSSEKLDLGRTDLEEFVEKYKSEEKNGDEANKEDKNENQHLSKEYELDKNTYEESKDDFNNPDLNNNQPDNNNTFFSGSIILIIWDMIMPGVILYIFKMFASPSKKEKLDEIDTDDLCLTEDQKEELQKMGLADHLSKVVFEKMNPILAFALVASFFTAMNIKLKSNKL